MATIKARKNLPDNKNIEFIKIFGCHSTFSNVYCLLESFGLT